MSNTDARNELTKNLRSHLRVLKYAIARGLSFARFHLAKVQACIDALGLTTTPMSLLTLVKA